MMNIMPREAMLYSKNFPYVVCNLCHHRCRIAPGRTGVCRARRNEDGKLVSLVYGRCVARHVDPIEKKPFFHFLPGSLSYSVATVGCNFRCAFCQNYQISQAIEESADDMPGEVVPPDDIIHAAVDNQCQSISYTYTEPTVFFEYALDIARQAREVGLANCFVSNGYMTPEAVDAIAPWLDAINVDLKGFNPEVYQKAMGGRLEGVLETIACLADRGIWMEITTLLVPGLNDSPKEIRQIAQYIAALNRDIPWHVSRFHPQYRMSGVPPTPAMIIEDAMRIGAEEGLRYVYSGNLREQSRENTACPGCGAALIIRSGFEIIRNRLTPQGHCPDCGAPCAGVWGARFPTNAVDETTNS